MIVYRITQAEFAKDLSGTGAKMFGGRWNPKGYAVLYTSAFKSLAALEVLVHIRKTTPPPSFKIITLQIPEESIFELDFKSYEALKWDDNLSTELQKMGKDWLDKAEHLVMKVPSRLITSESNYLINPLHEKMKMVSIIEDEYFTFDERFFMIT